MSGAGSVVGDDKMDWQVPGHNLLNRLKRRGLTFGLYNHMERLETGLETHEQDMLDGEYLRQMLLLDKPPEVLAEERYSQEGFASSEEMTSKLYGLLGQYIKENGYDTFVAFKNRYDLSDDFEPVYHAAIELCNKELN